MLYTIEVDKEELNLLTTSVRTQIQEERRTVVECLSIQNLNGAYLGKEVEGKLLSLLGKLRNIVVKGD